jgi:SAM-dependent methyltransferase
MDVAAFKAEQRANWDAVSPGWETMRDHFEDGAAAITRRLLDLGRVRRGQRVLDVATGHGEPALSAARLVGPSGEVVGIDISPAMLEVARRRAAGMDNVHFVEADVETLDQPPGSFDVVLSRFGLMLTLDHGAAFRALRRVLAPGGVLAAAVWGPPDEHLLSVGPAALARLLDRSPPPPDRPGPFSMSDPSRLIEELTAAGFADVTVTESVAPFRFDSAEAYIQYCRALIPSQMSRIVAERFGAPDAPEPWEAVARAVERHADRDGTIRLPSVALCFRAMASPPG